LVYGSDGNIYATGNGWTYRTGYYVTLSLTTGGSERWVNRRQSYDSLHYACGYSIIYGLDGNIYSTGTVALDPYEEEDIVVRSFTANGGTRFEYFRPLTGSNDRGYSLAYGLDNNIYVAGMLGESYAIIFSLTSSGSNNWEFLHYAWGVTSMVYGPDSNLYFGGWTIGFSVASLTSHTSIAEDKEAKNIPGQIKVPTYFSNEIKIRNTKTADSLFKVEIYNIQGALVYQKRFQLAEPTINIGGHEIADLSPGVYILAFTTGETTTTHKIVKVNLKRN
jgi:Secretion system C-terminal sorting domain